MIIIHKKISTSKLSPSQAIHIIISQTKFFVNTIIISSLITSLALPLSAFASIPNESTLDMFNTNGIYYYNPDGNNECISTSTTLSGNTAAEKIWNFFINQGFNDAQVAGILGNAMVESGLSPTRASNSSYWGLFQWGGGRKDALFAKVREAGLEQYLDSSYWPSGADANIPEADYDALLQLELEFAMSEQDYDWQNELRTSNTPTEAAEIFLVLFERAVNGNSEILYYAPFVGLLYQGTEQRRNYADDFYNSYSGNGTTSNTSPAATEGANLTIIGDSITVGSETALQDKFTSLKPEQINAAVGRTWQEGISIASSIALNDIVVFALGTNSANLTQSDIEAAIQTIGNNHTIVFVTNYGTADYTSNNNLFKQAAKDNPNIVIADWASTVSQNPELYLASDHIHPTSSGQQLFAETIFKAINSNTNANGCSVTGEFSTLVQGYAWPEYHAAPYVQRRPAYAEAVTASISEGRYVGGSVSGVAGIDCGGFVTILVQNSGLEPSYNDTKGGTGTQEKWVIDNGWTLLNDSNTTPIDTSVLQPGDVAFSGGTDYTGNGHTFIYVGDISGFDSVIASASYSTTGNGRAPMAGREDLIYSDGTPVRWYRKNL